MLPMKERDWFCCSLSIFGYALVIAIMSHDNNRMDDRRIYLHIVGGWQTETQWNFKSLILWHEPMIWFVKRQGHS